MEALINLSAWKARVLCFAISLSQLPETSNVKATGKCQIPFIIIISNIVLQKIDTKLGSWDCAFKIREVRWESPFSFPFEFHLQTGSETLSTVG